MTEDRLSPPSLNSTGQNLIRIVIASYFLAVSAGMIGGTRIDILLSPVLGPFPAEFLGRCLIFTLSFLVLCGVALRTSALLIAMLIFWASLILALRGHGPGRLETFWRDLALIAALMLTYMPTNGRIGLRDAAIIKTRRTVRSLSEKVRITPRRVGTPRPKVEPPLTLPAPSPTRLMPPPDWQDSDPSNIFAE